MKTPITPVAVTFPVLSTELLSESDRATIRADLAKLPHPSLARKAANSNGFAATPLDPRGRCVALTYKGVEVALLFQRLAQQVPAGDFAATPALELKTLDDAWVMFDLCSATAHAVATETDKTLSATQRELAEARALLVHTRRECDAKGYAIAGLEQRMDELKEALRAALKSAGQPDIVPDKPITVTPFKIKVVPRPIDPVFHKKKPVKQAPPPPVKKATKKVAKKTAKVAKKAAPKAKPAVKKPVAKKATKKATKKRP